MEFENARKSSATEREAFNSEKKGLMWRVADAEEKLGQEKQLNADHQKDWAEACERTNRELKAACDEVIRVNAEQTKESQKYDRLSAAYKEKESEALVTQRSNEEAHALIAKLKRMIEEQQAQNKTLKLMSQDLGDDYKWLLTHGVPLIADRLMRSEELAKYMFDLGGGAYNNGCKDGYAEGKAASLTKEKDDKF
ncbi:hypothetical protein Hanom_Chr06g00556281 [Helianthus anomalus]